MEFYIENELEENTYEVKIQFLVHNAPEKYLRIGNEFNVMDGKRIIANGLIIKDDN